LYLEPFVKALDECLKLRLYFIRIEDEKIVHEEEDMNLALSDQAGIPITPGLITDNDTNGSNGVVSSDPGP